MAIPEDTHVQSIFFSFARRLSLGVLSLRNTKTSMKAKAARGAFKSRINICVREQSPNTMMEGAQNNHRHCPDPASAPPMMGPRTLARAHTAPEDHKIDAVQYKLR